MKMTIDHKQIRNVAVFMTLLYAFTTRSILAKFLFQNQIELLAFYGVTYVCLIVSVIGAFFYDGVHLYAPKGFFSILTLFLVIFYGLILAHNNYSLLYYGLALLMPFAVFNEIKYNLLCKAFCRNGGVFYGWMRSEFYCTFYVQGDFLSTLFC